MKREIQSKLLQKREAIETWHESLIERLLIEEATDDLVNQQNTLSLLRKSRADLQSIDEALAAVDSFDAHRVCQQVEPDTNA